MPNFKCLGCKHVFDEPRGYSRHTGYCKKKIELKGEDLLKKRKLNTQKAVATQRETLEPAFPEPEALQDAPAQDDMEMTFSVICFSQSPFVTFIPDYLNYRLL
ncbi:MAG TPA: hypothetical protein VGO47_02770 [Chlamydiales bacterium]|jgi:hypothetical protein|nr:hypothetical protein [Chlamydiales bacterium]